MYRLIKEYPNSPGLGTIIQHRNFQSGCHEPIRVTDYPEYWEEFELPFKKSDKFTTGRLPTSTVYTISEIDLANQKVLVTWKGGKTSKEVTYHLNQAIEYFERGKWILKMKNPLFITDDNEPIYENDIYYGVHSLGNKGRYAYSRHRAYESTERGYGIKNFKSLSEAKEWIKENEDSISIKELKDACNSISHAGIWNTHKGEKRDIRLISQSALYAKLDI